MNMEKINLHDEIIEKVRAYYRTYHINNKEFEPGDRIFYSGRIYDEEEMVNLVDAALEFWLTQGRYSEIFENKLAAFVGTKYCSLVNSGSSANLAAFMSLTSDELGERKINRGDEVITVAAGFPTTISPIVQYGAVPVFVDVTIEDANINSSMLEEAVSSKSRAIFLAHTLGCPFDIKTVKKICEKYNLWLIEDNCDALGARYYYKGEWYNTGTLGDISTYSFYPPHHITLGEGGAVCTNNPILYRLINSYRDWGRDCWCKSGVDDTCKHRYTQQFGELPVGYDHKYVYSHFGYNLQATDLQAAIGCAQLDKLEKFIEVRKKNWDYLREGLDEIKTSVVLPEKRKDVDPSWFGFLMTVKEDMKFTRLELVQFLEEKNIQTRYLFAGNFLKHPCFNHMRLKKEGYRVVGDLLNTDRIMNNSFWIGVYPGMNTAKLDYMVQIIKEFINNKI